MSAFMVKKEGCGMLECTSTRQCACRQSMRQVLRYLCCKNKNALQDIKHYTLREYISGGESETLFNAMNGGERLNKVLVRWSTCTCCCRHRMLTADDVALFKGAGICVPPSACVPNGSRAGAREWCRSYT